MAMDPEAKAAWLEALRSGEYEQGRSTLAQILPDGSAQFCCLGVLCGVAGLPGTIEPWDGSGASRIVYEFDDTRGHGLASLNDGGKTFAEIADLIEAQL